MNTRISKEEATRIANEAGLEVTGLETLEDGTRQFKVGAIRVYHTTGGRACWKPEGVEVAGYQGNLYQWQGFVGEAIEEAVKLILKRRESREYDVDGHYVGPCDMAEEMSTAPSGEPASIRDYPEDYDCMPVGRLEEMLLADRAEGVAFKTAKERDLEERKAISRRKRAERLKVERAGRITGLQHAVLEALMAINPAPAAQVAARLNASVFVVSGALSSLVEKHLVHSTGGRKVRYTVNDDGRAAAYKARKA